MKNLLFFLFMFLLISCKRNGNGGSEADIDSSGKSIHPAEQVTEMSTVMNGMMMTMHMQKFTDDNDLDFATMMLEHHRGAVEMAKLELQSGTDTSLKKFAEKVMTDQGKEIAFMTQFIKSHQQKISPDAKDFQSALNVSMEAMMKDQPENYSSTDKDFAAQMIPHHQSAVDMANVYLKYGHDAELITLCKNIISTQTEEIGYLRGKLK